MKLAHIKSAIGVGVCFGTTVRVAHRRGLEGSTAA